jgi:hypothetical protein
VDFGLTRDLRPVGMVVTVQTSHLVGGVGGTPTQDLDAAFGAVDLLRALQRDEEGRGK